MKTKGFHAYFCFIVITKRGKKMYSSDYGTSNGGIGVVGVILWLILALIILASLWRIFEKAGYAGWKSIIPLYNLYCIYKMTWGNGWMFLLVFIPIINFVIGILTIYKLAKVFDKGIGFFFGLLFLNIVFYPILAFGDAQYVGIENSEFFEK